MRFRYWLGLAAVLAVAAGSVVGALIVHANDRADFERRQSDEAARAAHQAEAVAELSVGQMSSAAAFYQADRNFRMHQFEVIAHSLLHGGSLSATSFIPRVALGERSAFERAHGFPITELRGGRLRPAGRRPEYFPITYAISSLKRKPALGYDLGVDLKRRTILHRARDSGRAAATSFVPLLGGGGRGLVIYEPVYRDGAPTRTVAERRAALTGFAAGAFRVSDLSAAASSAAPDDVNLRLVPGGRALDAGEAATAPIKVADRTWQLVLHDPDGPDASLPLLMAIVGISLACLLGALIMIWSRNERMAELQRQASEDSLTGLKNRRRFEEELRAEMARSHRGAGPGALLMLDLDHFKEVNDSLGHQAGDRLLVEIAGILEARMRETDVLARLGGDEFAIVLPRSNTTEARMVADAIGAAIRNLRSAENDTLPVTASFGISLFGTKRRTSFESVLSEADTAMYAAKDAGRDGVRVFDPAAVGVRMFDAPKQLGR
jgi:diguanylate cyclase (GGDEF)-like protein